MKMKWIPALLLAAACTAQAQPMTFAVIGDFGNASKQERKVAKKVKGRNPEFVITTGDNNYPKGCWKTIDRNIGKYYADFIGNYKGKYGKGSAENRFFPSLGNHDWNAVDDKCLRKGDLPYLSYFTLPGNGRYYDFVKGPVHFYAVDSDPREPDGNKKGSKQYKWLKDTMAASTSCFNIVYFHHAPYSSGEHGSNKTLQWKFDELGADVVLAGHDHDYERVERDGIQYIVNGAGGAKIRKIDDKIKGSVYRYDKRNGYMIGTTEDNQLTLTFYDRKDKKKDSVTITKDCA